MPRGRGRGRAGSSVAVKVAPGGARGGVAQRGRKPQQAVSEERPFMNLRSRDQLKAREASPIKTPSRGWGRGRGRGGGRGRGRGRGRGGHFGRPSSSEPTSSGPSSSSEEERGGERSQDSERSVRSGRAAAAAKDQKKERKEERYSGYESEKEEEGNGTEALTALRDAVAAAGAAWPPGASEAGRMLAQASDALQGPVTLKTAVIVAAKVVGALGDQGSRPTAAPAPSPTFYPYPYPYPYPPPMPYYQPYPPPMTAAPAPPPLPAPRGAQTMQNSLNALLGL